MSRTLKRPAPEPISDTSSGSSSQFASQRSFRLPIFASNLQIHILEDKLQDGQKQLLESIITKHGGTITPHYSDADVIATELRGPKRLSRAIPQPLWSEKTFVPVSWITKSLDAEKQQPFSDYTLSFDGKPASRKSSPPLQPLPSVNSTPVPVASTSNLSVVPRARKTDALPSVQFTIDELRARWVNTNLACLRFCPLVCINEALVQELGWIRLGRKLLDGEETSALAYSRAISTIKGYPWPITEKTRLTSIEGIGQTVAAKIEEYLRTGSMQDAEGYRKSRKLAELRDLTQVYGIGEKNARVMHGRGYTTLAKLPKEFNTKWTEEFAQKIPRQEVSEIAELVAEHLEKVRPGAEYCITGGYRRGKPASNDIDIVMSHRDTGKDKHMLSEVTASLQEAGIIVDIIYRTNTSTNRPAGAQNYHASRLDPLDKNFCVFMPPKRGCLQQIHRRVDLIVCPWKYYWTAIVGWSGSTQFERDIRRHADRVDFKFDSGGLTHKTTSQDYIATSEEHLFQMLQLPYIPPNYRNADL